MIPNRKVEQWIRELVQEEMKSPALSSRYIRDRSLIPRKIAPGETPADVGTAGKLLTVGSSGYPTWATPSGKTIGYSADTDGYTSGSIGTTTNSTSIMSLAVTGDGTTAVWLDFYTRGPYISAGTAGHFDLKIWDGAVGSGTVIQECQLFAGAINESEGGRSILARVAAFSGSKTFNIAFYNNTGGNATFQIQSSSTAPTYLRATWE